MIYPDIPLKVWLKKYPDLEVLSHKCESCGEISKSETPFLTKEYAGLESQPCSCGKGRGGCSTYVTITKEAHLKWSNLIGWGE